MIVVMAVVLCLTQSAFAVTNQASASPSTVSHKTTHAKKVVPKATHSKHKKQKVHSKKKKVVHHKKHHKVHHVKKVAPVEDDSADDESDVTESENKQTTESRPVEAEQVAAPVQHTGLMSSLEHHLVNYVYETVDTLRHNSYKLGGTRFDSEHGVYKLDCSSYVDHLLEQASPNAYFSLVDSTGTDKPTTQHYYDFFTDLAAVNNSYWNRIDEVGELRAGDILVLRYKNSRGYQTGGHVVIVMDKPIQDTNVFFLRVADSARSRHSQDTRHRHESGIGIGTMLLKVNPKTGEPAAFAWGVGSYWNKNVTFAMARPAASSFTKG